MPRGPKGEHRPAERQGDIWTVAGGQDYAGKPRAAAVVQGDGFDATDAIATCAITTNATDAPLFRLSVEPNQRHSLRAACRPMVDKISTVSKSKIGAHIGKLDNEDTLRLDSAALVFLRLAVSLRAKETAELTRDNDDPATWRSA